MKPVLSKIHYAKPSITALEIEYASDAAAHGWGDQCYTYISRFQDAFAAYIGTRHALATSSATGAMQLGLAALGIGEGDEVILADINWIATAAPIVHVGATPVFVDVLPDTWCIDPEKVEAAITAKTKAIVAVHLYGNLCDMSKLEALARKCGVHLIEDAAEAIGSQWGKQRAGSRGIFGVFSFHGTKTITTGEGGMLVTNDAELHETASMLNNHGRTRHEKRQFFASTVGYKFKMSNIQAAIGCAQLERVDALVARRREIFFTYAGLLKNIAGVRMNPVPQQITYGYWMPVVVFDVFSPLLLSTLVNTFAKNTIDARAFFSPLSSQAHFTAVVDNRISYSIYRRAVNLPSYHDIRYEEQERVVDAIRCTLETL